jgi:sulfide dehydrogenase cytochrome subunit
MMRADKGRLSLQSTMPSICHTETRSGGRSIASKRNAAKELASGFTALAGVLLTLGVWAADMGNMVETCTSCHGNDGVTTEADVPTIAGYSADYISAQMDAYKKKERACPETDIRSGGKKGTKSDMCQVVKDLGDADIDQLAKYYAKKKFVPAQQNFDPASAKKGKEIHDVNCDKCHQQGGSLANDDAGILAGQRMQYLKAQLEDFRSGKRSMMKNMKSKIDRLQKDDFDALINYYGSLK